ncbi:MAG: hypothetical protein ACRC2K_12505 [Clostridium sp.]
MKKNLKTIAIQICIINILTVILLGCNRNEILSNSDIKRSNILVVKNGDSLKIASKYNSNTDLILHFNLLGINKLMHLKEVLKNYNEDKYPSDNLASERSLYEVTTDWISPYGLVSKDNIVNSKAGFTVGGNHGTDGAKGISTAKCDKVTVKVDDRIIEKNETIYGNQIEIEVINKIYSSNSIDIENKVGTYGLKEKVVYKIDNKSMKVNVELEALDDVIITRYVGLQASLTYYDNLIMKYKNSQVKEYVIKEIGEGQQGLLKNEQVIDRFILENKEDRLTCKINSEGLGSFEYVDENNPTCYTNSTKVYMHTIKGKKLNLNSGEKVNYNGEYIFESINDH